MKRSWLQLGSIALMVLLALALAWFSGSANVAKAQSSLNVVYVMSNIGCAGSNLNSIYGFSNDGAGNLTALPGSPYLTGGSGVCDSTKTSGDADQELIVRKDGDLLFAVNAHSNNISVFNINADGSLTAVSGSPFASGGIEPISLGLSDDLLSGDTDVLTVANRAADPNQGAAIPNFTTFKVNAAGAITPVTGGTVTLASGAAPSQALPVHAGHFLIGLQFGASKIDSYHMKLAGTMALDNELGSPVTGDLMLGMAAHPTRRVIYVGLPNGGAVAVYSFDKSTGNLTFLKTVKNQGAALCWLTVNTAGTRLYTAESGSNTLTVYDVSVFNNPVQKQHFTLTSNTGGPTNLQIDPTGQFLYVLSGSSIHVLNIAADGTVSETITPVNLGISSTEDPFGMATLLR